MIPKRLLSTDKAISVKTGPLLIKGVKVPVELSTGPTCPELVETIYMACAVCAVVNVTKANKAALVVTNSKFLKTVFLLMGGIKFPAPALELNSKGKLKGHLFYF